MAAVLATVGSTAVVWANQTAPTATLNFWWPTVNSQLSGQQPFKGNVDGHAVENYKMYWQVDGGGLNLMPSSYDGYPHKETTVDVSNWNWRSNGNYTITFVAHNASGSTVAQNNVTVYVKSASTTVSDAPASTTTSQTAVMAPVVASAPTPTPPAPSPAPKLYTAPNSPAAMQASAWRASRPADAATMDRLAAQPTAKWLGGWNQDVESDTRGYVQTAQAANALPVLVAYNIPQRDCGSYSAGGTTTAAYLDWIRAIARGIGSSPALILVEPDALAGMDCLNTADKAARQNLLSEAVKILKQQPDVKVYLDAGHARWHSADVMAARLKAAGVSSANGFSLNVSNFINTQENVTYGNALSTRLNGAHFVVDTSRNGLGTTADSQWCNPQGRAIGQLPTLATGNALADAYLWVKTPGESDGTCNGGPSAGTWWGEYALGLAQRAGL